MVRETRVQSQVTSYQRFKKLYLIPPCLTLSNKRYASSIKWRNPAKGVAPFSTHLSVVAIEKGAVWSSLTTVAKLTYHSENEFIASKNLIFGTTIFIASLGG